MNAWLDPVRDALDAAPAPVPVFFRDDDAGWADRRLFALLDRFAAHGVPVDLAVIPRALTPGTARALHRRLRTERIGLHQHGLAHTDHEAGTPGVRRCEFGPSRRTAVQVADVAAGRALLLDAFGAALDPVFTPPWNRCTPATGAALVTCGIVVLSRDAGAGRLGVPDLREVPVTLDWAGRTRGVPWTPAGRARRLAAQLRGGGPVGVMLHHAVLDESGRDEVAALLGLLARHGAAAPVPLLGTAVRAVH